MLKTGQQEKLYPPTDVSVSLEFENLVHSIFRNENSTLKINVSHFGVLHWQQWQPPTSIPDCINPLCSCAIMDIESTSHFFLHCPLFDNKTSTLMSTLNKTDCKLKEMNESSLIETLLFGNSLFDLKKNSLILS